MTTSAVDVGIDAPFADVYVLPSIAGHVGADTAGVILNEGPTPFLVGAAFGRRRNER
ncbi:MAG: hypothetical protein R2706_02780 [Acidimicrobiales bacterium]